MSIQSTENYCSRCKEIRSNVHQCYDDKNPKPMLDFGIDDKGPWYGLDREKLKLVPDVEKSKQMQEKTGSKEYEAFRPAERTEKRQ